MSLETVVKALQPHQVRRSGTGWASRCPAHEDSIASLSVSQGTTGGVVVNCHAGCETKDVVEALGLAMTDLAPANNRHTGSQLVAEYDYYSDEGDLLYQVCRFEPKTFRQRRPDGRGGWEWGLGEVPRVLYCLPDLLEAPADKPVFVVEGEKDVDNLRALGLIATTNLGGAGKGKWHKEYSQALEGRNVVIIPDNDAVGKEHAAEVAASLDGVAKSVQILELPGLPLKGDVSDWLAAGGTADKLIALTTADSAAFATAADRVRVEKSGRAEIGTRVLGFGVKFLDDALGGIAPNDLILYGAKTGVGKTALATITALHNVRQGKRVHYFALEAEESEIERRMLFQEMASRYYRGTADPKPLRYLDWYLGRLDREVAKYEAEATKYLADRLKNLHTSYRDSDFTGDDFCRHLERIKDKTDLVILDHLNYLDTEEENENRGYKRIVKKIRHTALKVGKPVIVVAHVRKADKRNEPLIPGIEEFHGTSDIPKISTKAVMLAPAYDKPTLSPTLWNTYFQAAKCRLDGSVTRYGAIVAYNAQEGRYDERYFLGRFENGGKEFKYLVGDEQPTWSKAVPYNE